MITHVAFASCNKTERFYSLLLTALSDDDYNFLTSYHTLL